MKAKNAALGSLAAGVALGLLASSKKGSALRKKISKMPGKMKDSLKDTVDEVKHMFTATKDEAAVAAKKTARKTASRVKKVRSKK